MKSPFRPVNALDFFVDRFAYCREYGAYVAHPSHSAPNAHARPINRAVGTDTASQVRMNWARVMGRALEQA